VQCLYYYIFCKCCYRFYEAVLGIDVSNVSLREFIRSTFITLIQGFNSTKHWINSFWK